MRTATRKATTSNTAWLLGERGVQFASGLLVGAYVARYLGVEQYGLLTYASAFTFLLIPLALAAQPLVVRDLVLEPDRERSLLGTAAAFAAACVTLAAALSIGLATLGGGDVFADATPLLAILSISVLVRPVHVVDFWFQARVKSRTASLARTTALVVTAVLRVGLVLAGAPLWAFAAAISLDAVLATVLLYVGYRRTGGSGQWRVERTRVRRLSRESAPLVLASVSSVIYMRIDQVMLGALSDRAQNAFYSVAVVLSEAAYFLPVALVSSVTPSLVRLHAESRARFLERLQEVYALLTALAYVLSAAAFVLVAPVVRLLFGADYEGAVQPFLILTAALPVVFLGVAQSVWNTMEQHQVLSLLRTVAAAIVNVSLNVYLLPRYGAVGAAVSTVVAQVIASCLGNAFARATRPALVMQLRALLLLDLPRAVRHLRADG